MKEQKIANETKWINAIGSDSIRNSKLMRKMGVSPCDIQLIQLLLFITEEDRMIIRIPVFRRI